MDSDKPGEKREYRYYFVICIDRCLGYCQSMVDRLVCGIQAEQEKERKIKEFLCQDVKK